MIAFDSIIEGEFYNEFLKLSELLENVDLVTRQNYDFSRMVRLHIMIAEFEAL